MTRLAFIAPVLAGLALGGCATTSAPVTTDYVFAFVRSGQPNILYRTATADPRDNETCFNVVWNELAVPAPGEIAVRGELTQGPVTTCGGRILILDEYVTDIQR